MATRKKAAVKKAAPEERKILYVELQDKDMYDELEEFPGCCGARILHEAGNWCSTLTFAIHYKDAPDSPEEVSVGQPGMDIKKLDKLFVEAVNDALDGRTGLIMATTILRSSRGVTPNSRISDQGIANLLLPQFGFTLADQFRGNTGNLLGLWTRKRRGMKV